MNLSHSIFLKRVQPGLWPISVGLLYYLLAVASLVLTRDVGGVATVWPPSGLLLATLLLVPRSTAHRYIAASAVGSLLANLSVDVPATLAVGFTAANMAESALAAWLLHRWAEHKISFSNSTGMIRFCIASGIAASASAALAAGVSSSDMASFYLSWFSTDMLGMLIVTPIIVIVVENYRDRKDGLNTHGWSETVACLGATAILSATVFLQSSYPLLFLPMAGVLVAVFRLGSLGAAASVFTIALISSIAISFGSGPTALIESGSAPIFFLQFYLLTLLAVALPVAALLANRDRLLAELFESNRLLDEAKQVAEHSASIATCAAETDELTGLPNRRKAIQILEASKARSDLALTTVAIFDIDHFKRVNDDCGHLIGDQVLRRVAMDAAGTLRGNDFIGRFGGEEFILILPQTSVDHALLVAERVCQAVAAGGSIDGIDPKVTVSLGMAVGLVDDTIETILHRADVALYQAKEGGRNAFRIAA